MKKESAVLLTQGEQLEKLALDYFGGVGECARRLELKENVFKNYLKRDDLDEDIKIKEPDNPEVLIPTTSPSALTKAPPENPGRGMASVRINLSIIPPRRVCTGPFTALMTPKLASTPDRLGRPTASTISPIPGSPSAVRTGPVPDRRLHPPQPRPDGEDAGQPA